MGLATNLSMRMNRASRNPIDLLLANIDRATVFNPDSAVSLSLSQDNTSDRTGTVTSSEVVHPSVERISGGWNGHEYWMAITGYEAGNDRYENPSIMHSDDGITWSQSGITNPVFLTPSGTDYQADVRLWYEAADDKLHMVWFRTKSSRTEIGIQYSNSSDGNTWAAEQEIVDGTISSGKGDVLSPCVVKESDGTYSLYTVNAQSDPNVLQRRTASTVTGTWSATTDCTFDSLPFDTQIWHIEVERYKERYLAVLTLQADSDDAQDTHLRLAWSDDGLAFTVASEPLVNPRRDTTAPAYDSTGCYMGSLVSRSNSQLDMRLFYTVYDANNDWSFTQADLEIVQPDSTVLGTPIFDWDYTYRTSDPVTSGGTFAKTTGADLANDFVNGTPDVESDGVLLDQEGIGWINESVIPTDLDYTFAFRFKITVTPTTESVVIRCGPLMSTLRSDGLFRMWRFTGTWAGWAGPVSFKTQNDTWYTVVVATDGSKHKMYINGYYVEQNQSLTANDLVNIGIGGFSGLIYPDAKVSHLKIWDTTATTEQMVAIQKDLAATLS